MTMDQTVPLQTPQTSSRADDSLKEHHVTGAITVFLEVALLVENLLPLIVVLWWKRPGERTIFDKLVTALCVTYIFSALVPTPLGLVSYIVGRWYGGKDTCECYQVTTTWCSLSAMALVTNMCIDRHQSLCPCRSCIVGKSCMENVGLILIILYMITLAISTLPVVGLGPDIMKGNETCDSWIVLTPSEWKQRIFFVSYLSFGYFNILISTSISIFLLVLLHNPDLEDTWKKTKIPVEEGVSQLLRPRRSSENTSWVIISLVLLHQLTWIPLLVMLTCQKLGIKVSEAAMMYGLLATSLPGLLNPLLYGLLLDSYREGYKKILLKLCTFCRKMSTEEQELKGIKSSNAMFSSERKRLTKVRLRDYSQSQSGASFNPGFETDSITELVDCPETSDEEDFNCRLECQGHISEFDQDVLNCDFQDNLYQSGSILQNDAMIASSDSSEDCFIMKYQHSDVEESAI